MEIKHYDQASQLWLQFKDGLKGYIFKKTNNAQLADEINQEVLLKVINSCCSNIEIKNVRSWLFQIAHNTTIAFLKEHKKYVSEAVELSESNDKSDSVYEDIIPFLEPLIEFLPDKYALPLKMADID
jgi:RNA polymerase sigma-70 factor (ECF subfamily)